MRWRCPGRPQERTSLRSAGHVLAVRDRRRVRVARPRGRTGRPGSGGRRPANANGGRARRDRRPRRLAAAVRANWDGGRHLHPDERYLSQVEDAIKWPDSIGEYLDVHSSPLSPYNTETGKHYVYGQLPLFGGKLLATILGQDDYGHLNLADRRLCALIDTGSIVLVFLLAWTIFAGLGCTGRDRRRACRRRAVRLHRGCHPRRQTSSQPTAGSSSSPYSRSSCPHAPSGRPRRPRRVVSD